MLKSGFVEKDVAAKEDALVQDLPGEIHLLCEGIRVVARRGATPVRIVAAALRSLGRYPHQIHTLQAIPHPTPRSDALQ